MQAATPWMRAGSFAKDNWSRRSCAPSTLTPRRRDERHAGVRAVDRLQVRCDEGSFALESRSYVAADGEEIPGAGQRSRGAEFRAAAPGSMSAAIVHGCARQVASGELRIPGDVRSARRDPGVERNSGNLVTAAEILHVAGHPRFGSAGSLLRSASTMQRCATSIRERPCGTGRSSGAAKGKQACDGLHREHQHAVAAGFRQHPEEFHDASYRGLGTARRFDGHDRVLELVSASAVACEAARAAVRGATASIASIVR